MAQILIVEPDARLADAWEQALALDGHEVDTRGDGLSALELVDKNPPELAITEIMLPRLGGVGFAGRVKLRDPAIMVVATTGDPAALAPGVDALAHARRVGADLLLEKPIESAALVLAVRQLLAQG